MSEPVLEFLTNSTITLVIVIFTGSLIVLGVIFEVVWHMRKRMKNTSIVTGEVVGKTQKRLEGKRTSDPMLEMMNEIRAINEKINRQENDISGIKSDISIIKNAVTKFANQK